MKACRRCAVDLVVGDNWTHYNKKASNNICLCCKRKEEREWYIKNPEKASKIRSRATKKWRKNHPEWQKQYLAKPEVKERNRKKCKEWEAENKEWKRRYHQKYRDNNPGWQAMHNQKRRAALLRAIPAWADEEKIRVYHIQAKKWGMDVDHIVPLQSSLVCGLHCQDNLQLLCPEENRAKNNRYWPDMP